MAGGVLCVLFTDLVGSTDLMTRLGDLAFDRLRSQHFAELREVIEGVGGTEIKNTGDGLLATFTSAVDALAAATGAQRVTGQPGRGVRASGRGPAAWCSSAGNRAWGRRAGRPRCRPVPMPMSARGSPAGATRTWASPTSRLSRRCATTSPTLPPPCTSAGTPA